MFWALLLIVGIIGFVAFPGIRMPLLVIVAGLVVLVVGFFVYLFVDDHQRAQQRAQREQQRAQHAEVSKRLVSIEDLEFSDVRLELSRPRSSYYELSGRVKNNSQYTVSTILARIQVLDCDESSDCEVVGEKDEFISLGIPPGQVRDIDEGIFFGSGTRVRNQFRWNYAITEIRAEP